MNGITTNTNVEPVSQSSHFPVSSHVLTATSVLGSALESVRAASTAVDAGAALRVVDSLTGSPLQSNQLVLAAAKGAAVQPEVTNPADGGWVNPTGGAIRSDSGGDGHYGASRSRVGGVHYGVDYSGVAGQDVVAPISGTIKATRANAQSVLGGFNIVSDDGRTRITVLYAPLNAGLDNTRVTAGQAVATQSDLQTYNARKGHSEYPANVGDHVHVQAQIDGRRVDPTSYIGVPSP
jgi:murein DD-endopeptidase MepM/ murein hydrolase activator NlpD